VEEGLLLKSRWTRKEEGIALSRMREGRLTCRFMGWRMGEGIDEWEGVRVRDSGRVRASGTEGDGSERWKGERR
jgi:hypothetical protein